MNTIYQIAPKRSGHRFVQNMIQEWLPDVEIQDMENARGRKMRAVPKDSVVVLQMRDLLNWMASYTMSCLGKGRMRVEVFDFERRRRNMMRLWRPIAYEYYGVTHHLNVNKNKVFHVFYDDFFKSPAARRLLCRQLGGVYTENKLNQVDHGGCGSSFDGMGYNGRAQEMDTLTRYAQGHERLQRFYRYVLEKDPKLLRFYKQYQHPNKQKIEFLT